MNFTNYLNMPKVQTAGTFIFLLALALLLGASMLAFVGEVKDKSSTRNNFPIMSYNITRSTWIWIFIFAISGGTTVFLPQTATLTKSNPLLITAICSSVALLFYLIYHFSAKIIRSKFLHAPLAFFATGSALGAASFWYLPHICNAWFQNVDNLATAQEILFWWLGRVEIACFLHFFLNSIGVAALFFMLANAAEKEKKRKQSRDYYFQAAGYAGRWLLSVVTLQALPLTWIFYNKVGTNPALLLHKPEVYWLAAMLISALMGWLLLIKITKDGLVNRRATLIIALFFIISLSLFHFSPLQQVNTTTAALTQNQAK